MGTDGTLSCGTPPSFKKPASVLPVLLEIVAQPCNGTMHTSSSTFMDLARDEYLNQLARTMPPHQIQGFPVMSCELPKPLPHPRAQVLPLSSILTLSPCSPVLACFLRHLTVLEIR